MIYKVRHKTRMRYAAPVANARFNLRLKPVAWPGQTISDVRLEMQPQAARVTDKPGPYLVTTTQIEFVEDLVDLTITSTFRAEVGPRDLPGAGPSVAQICREALLSRDISTISPAPYLFGSRLAGMDGAIGSWAQSFFAGDASILEAIRNLASRLHGEMTFSPGATDTGTAPQKAFAERKGVCQDFAHIMIMALRWQGIPAAYASGYLRTIPPPGKDKLVGADAMHAWVNVWCGSELGWVGIDPTNDCFVGGDHIQIAMGRDYADVAPVDGTFIGSAPQSMVSGVDVLVDEPAPASAN